jgi:hypothetical protein
MGAVIFTVVGPALLRAVRFPKTFQQIAIGLGMALFGFAVARLHLHFFDKIFLREGRIDVRNTQSPP